jgi:catalase
VTVRFSNFAGIPTIPDNDPQGASPRGCAIRFHLADHVHTDIVAHSVDTFPARTVEEFLEFLNALIATDPAGPHPNRIEEFLRAHPAAHPKTDPSKFCEGVVFCGVGFQVHQRGRRKPVRTLSNAAGSGQ